MKSLTRFALVLWTAASLIVSPVYAQAQSTAPQQNQQTQSQQETPPQNPAQQPTKAPTPPEPPDIIQMATAPGVGSVEPISPKGLSTGRNYSKGKNWFPNIFDQYWPTRVPPPTLTNTPKVDQLIQNGQLMLSLDNAIALALQDNLDIRVQQYQTWVSQTQLLKAEAGGIPQAGNSQAVTLGAAPSVSFDPEVTAQTTWTQSLTPVNNAFTSGAGTAVPTSMFRQHDYQLSYAQGFHTGTAFSVAWDNQRSSSNFTSFVFNPWVQTFLTATVTQPLLNGCCIFPTTRFILVAQNDTKIADASFRAAVITDITQTAFDYWELVFDREFVKVEQQAVAASQKLYNDNKRQLQIGTMAPLDVLTAQSQLASDQQSLVSAQTNVLLQQTKLLNDITKDPLAGNLKTIEIVPTTPIETPEPVDTPLDQLMSEAWQNVPQMTVDRLNLTNNGIEVRATANALKPSLNLFLKYQSTGLAGIHTGLASGAIPTGFVADPTLPVVDASGAQPAPPLFLGSPIFAPSAMITTATGVGTAEHNMFNATYPTYEAGITLGLPLRNRSAQADNARALLDERYQQTLYQEDRNKVYVNVRQSLIQMDQDRATITAAAEATRLARQSYVDEEKRYQLGASTSYNVVLKQRDLTLAESTELRDRINLIEAQVNFNASMGRTLDANKITIADSLRGNVMGVPNIPGTPDTAAADSPNSRNWSVGSRN